ncbi:hypothetical protein L484_023532 [Morus notabilis]|uniref:Uncharacterized protein n=1 Tax=Morus notabilis TaxID=981085 RepID=W9R6Z1_9ROSA|nr:hypothetical protein L484_023532 [Morus notabilis]
MRPRLPWLAPIAGRRVERNKTVNFQPFIRVDPPVTRSSLPPALNRGEKSSDLLTIREKQADKAAIVTEGQRPNPSLLDLLESKTSFYDPL